ncbi:MAG: enoyl-CoA hydratase/isomerase family protein [Flavobacteriales bacterium]
MEIITSVKEKIGTIIINREKSYNSLSLSCIQDITQTLKNWENDISVKVIIVTGAGNKSFVSGADISEFTGLNVKDALAFSQNGQKFLQTIENYPKPIIAAINGYALGGGFELALACHIRVAADHAQMGLPEVKLGIIPGYGGTWEVDTCYRKINGIVLCAYWKIHGCSNSTFIWYYL